MHARPLDAFAATLVFGLCIVWGFNQVAVKLALPDVGPISQTGIRSGTGALCVIAYAFSTKRHIFEIDGTEAAGALAGAIGGLLAFPVIARLVGGDAEDPRLHPAAAVKRRDILNDSQKSLLANLLHVFAREGRRQLEDEPGRRRVMKVEKRVPGPVFSLPATGDQWRFGIRTHGPRLGVQSSKFKVQNSSAINEV